jgi:hypothetical protein
MRHAASQVLAWVALPLLAACGGEPPVSEPPTAEAAPEKAPAPTTTEITPEQEAWWRALKALCGNAYAGRLVSNDTADADIANEPMVLHVRECSEDRISIPFHVGENRSRTWVITLSEAGIALKHDHRHIDGEIDAITQYGGHTVTAGKATIQHFPADDFSKELFDEQQIPDSKMNVWSFAIIPDKRFSYILRRPNRWFQADFDLSTPVTIPPDPWGHPALETESPETES